MAASSGAAAQERPSACPEACLPGESTWIADIRLDASPAEVEQTLGAASSREVGYGEDDGGWYEETKLIYPGLEVYIVRGVVDRVVGTSAASCTANGICPGMTKTELRNRIASISESLVTPDLRSFYLCVERCNADYYLLIDYNASGEIEKIELVTDRP